MYSDTVCNVDVYIQPDEHAHQRVQHRLRQKHCGAAVSYPIHDLMCLLAKIDEEMSLDDWRTYFSEKQTTQASLQSLDMFIASRALNPKLPVGKRERFTSISTHMRRLMYISPFIDINRAAARAT